MLYDKLFRPLLFSQDPEVAHERTLRMLETLARSGVAAARPFTHERLRVQIAGIDFPNPVGLAAGCDKNAKAVAVWPRFGFGFVEIGTVTADAQPGNPKPRVFRLAPHGAIINRLGFNGEGSRMVAFRLERLRRRGHPLPVPLAVNIGKTKRVTGDDAVLEDYRASFQRLARYADFVVVNVSSPNTPGLRQWQEREKLSALLRMLVGEAAALAVEPASGRTGEQATHLSHASHRSQRPEHRNTGTPEHIQPSPVPIFVKLSPDMADADMDDVVEVAFHVGLAGIIATNTTVAREGVIARYQEAGGLSGRPLKERALRTLRYLYRRSEGCLPLIGVGGISSAEDAYERIKAGASLVQLYTGLVYEGPSLPRRISQGLLRLMDRDGVKNVADLVGTEPATG